jgi:hypothetical protein
MSNNLPAVQNQSPNSVVFYSVRSLNFDAILNKLDEEMPQTGVFPGDALSFDGKRGQWKWGFGQKAQSFDHRKVQFVFNMPNAAAVWQRFINEGGKSFPHFDGLTFFASPAKFPGRETLGDTDPTKWPIDSFNKQSDPWKECVMVPVRIHGDEQVNHLFLSTISGVIAFKNFLRTWAEQGRSNIGKLPIVNVGVETRPRKDSKETYDAPTFTIAGWVDPIASDIPDEAEQTAALADIPDAEVNSVTRDTVQALQAEANASAEQEVQKTSATVQQMASQAGARPAAPTKPAGLFAGARRGAPARV